MAKSKKIETKKNSGKQSKIATSGDRRYVKRNSKGQFVASSDLSQVRNSATGSYILREKSGRIVEISQNKPFKGIRSSKSEIKSNPNVKKSTASKAEKAVVKVRKTKR